MTVQQQLHCEVGCNDDERGRGQELLISVTLFDSLREKLLKAQPDAEDVEAQQRRAASAEWEAHARAQQEATHKTEMLARIVHAVAMEGRWFTIEALADCIARQVLAESHAPQVSVRVDKPDALRKRQVRTAACEVTRTWAAIFEPKAAPEPTDRVMTLDQQIHCEIGSAEHERGRFQEVLVSITVWDRLRYNVQQHQPDFDDLATQKAKAASPNWKEHAMLQLKGTHNNALLAKIAQRVAEEGKWFTMEALAESIASQVLAACGAPAVTVRVAQPQALRHLHAEASACEITRCRPLHTS